MSLVKDNLSVGQIMDFSQLAALAPIERLEKLDCSCDYYWGVPVLHRILETFPIILILVILKRKG